MDERETFPGTVTFSPAMAERGDRIRKLVQDAMERPADERRAFLAAASALDTMLVSEATAMLEAHGALGPSVVERLSTAAASYRITRELGRGGMGVVYLADQLLPLRRVVAIKLVNAGMDATQVGARFEAERQALALMDHSHIAHVYDAGTTTDGRLFFAMEYVDGTSLTRFCDTHRLDIKARLDLFSDVCAAVQHAHQKGVIHRDLKPSNVLVTEQDGRPVPKIIDFGIAKAINQRLSDRSFQTEQGWPIGTPEYMSPEQTGATGSDLDTRTDIYSLGVLLYELLVGKVPFDGASLRRAGYAQMQRIIREEEPLLPSAQVRDSGNEAVPVALSRQTSVPALVNAVRGDLDWITLKALEKDPARRYASASELASDIRRHLEDEPVIARPSSLGYRTQKFVTKHRRAAAVAAALILVLTVGLVASTTLYLRAERSRAEADRQRQLYAEQRAAAESAAREARRQRDTADVQRGVADRHRAVSEAAGREADRQRRLAEVQRQNATVQRRDAERQRDEAQHQSYRSALLAADLSMRQGDIREASRQLQITSPALRGWEWRFLRAMTDTSLARIGAPAAIRNVAIRGATNEIIALGDFPRLGRGQIGLAGRVFRSVPEPWNAKALPNDYQSVLPSRPPPADEFPYTLIAISPDGARAIGAGWNLATTAPSCSSTRPGTVTCGPMWRSSPEDQTGRALAPEERDRLFVVDTVSHQLVATLHHPGLGVWTGPEPASGPPLVRPGGTDSEPALVDRSTARPIATLTGRFPEVVSAVFSADGRRVATWSWDRVIRVWDVESQTQLASLTGDSARSSTVTFDGSDRLVTATIAGTVRAWTLRDQTTSDLLHVDGLTSLAVAGEQIAVGTESGDVQLWERGEKRPRYSTRAHQAAVSSLSLSPDSILLASTGSGDRDVVVWDARATAAPIRLHGHASEVLSVAWHPNGRFLVSGSTDGTFRVWSATQASVDLEVKGPESEIRSLGFTAAGRLLSVAMDGRLREWAPPRAEPARIANFDAQPGERAIRERVSLSADGRRIIAPYFGRGTTIVRLLGADPTELLPPLSVAVDSGTLVDIRDSADGRKLAALLRHPSALEVKVWDTASGKPYPAVKVEGRWIFATIALSHSGDRVAIATHLLFGQSGVPTGQVRVFDVASGQLLTTLAKAAGGPEPRVAFSADGSRIVTTDIGGGTQVWNTATGELVGTLTGHVGPVLAVLVTLDGRRILTGGGDNTVRLWDAARCELLLTLRIQGNLTALAVSRDGDSIAAGTRLGGMHLWNAGPPAAR